MKKSIGIIGGTGNQGSALAGRLLSAGHPVKIGSRSEDRGRNTADQLNDKFDTNLTTGGTNKFAVQADIIVLAIPFNQVDTLLDPLKSHFEGKLVIDLTVNLSFGKYIQTKRHDGKSSYEYIRDKFDTSEVVACLKTISHVLLRRDDMIDQTDFQMTLSDDAYEFTSNLVQQFGLQPVRVRGKMHAHTIERMVALSIQLNKEYDGSHTGYKVTNLKLD